MTKIITTITDPNHPNFGQVTDTDIDGAPPVARSLTAAQFHAFAGTTLTDARVGNIINDLETAAKNGGTARVAWQRYSAANAPGGWFTKSDFELISAGLVALGIMTSQERGVVLSAWPMTN